MERAARRERFVDWLWFLTCVAVSSTWCVGAALHVGATFDEPPELARALEFWRRGTHAPLLRVGTMPLPMDLAALPVYCWERWHGTEVDFAAGDQTGPLFWARAMTLLFWWLLLTYGWLSARWLAGPWGGRLAVALLACEPTLLAHASLATKDIAVSACLLALCYHFRGGREAGWPWRVGVPALWFGLAVLTKASGLVFGPLCLLVLELADLSIRETINRHSWAVLRSFRRDLLQIMVLGLILVFAYCGCDWQPEPSFVRWAQQMPEGPTRDALVWLSENLRIFSNAGEGLVKQVKHNLHGHGVYLLGDADPRVIWYYFPVALSIKLSLTVLLLPLLLAILRPRVLLNWACLAAAALLLFSLTCRVQIGVRLMLPLVGLAITGLAAALVLALRQVESTWKKRGLAVVTATGVLWTAVSAAAVWPHALCYTNELWGGTANGHLCLSDSNYDWGQGLKELHAWQRAQRLPEIDVWYFGTDPLLTVLPMRKLDLHELPAADVAAAVRGRHLAVGTTMLCGAYWNNEGRRAALDLLRSHKPVARTQTFFIYDFTAAPAYSGIGAYGSEVHPTATRSIRGSGVSGTATR